MGYRPPLRALAAGGGWVCLAWDEAGRFSGATGPSFGEDDDAETRLAFGGARVAGDAADCAVAWERWTPANALGDRKTPSYRTLWEPRSLWPLPLEVKAVARFQCRMEQDRSSEGIPNWRPVPPVPRSPPPQEGPGLEWWGVPNPHSRPASRRSREGCWQRFPHS